MTNKIKYFQWLSWKFQKDAINPWKAFGEVGQKSWGAAEGKAEEACEVSPHNWRKIFKPRSLTHCGKISGKAKTVVKDADVPKSLKVTLRMASKCGVSRFWKIGGRFLVLSCKHVHFCDNKSKLRLKPRFRRCRSTICEGLRSRWVGDMDAVSETREDFFYETKRSRQNKHA